MDFTDFERSYKANKTQLFMSTLIADTDTPVSVFLKMGGDTRLSILLESVEGGDVLGRYSAIGLDPDQIWVCQDSKSKLFHRNNPHDAPYFDQAASRLDFIPDEDNGQLPLIHLRQVIADSRLDGLHDDLPPMLSSGFFGFLGYDMIRLSENIPDNNPDPLNIPDAVMIRPRLMIVFDNIKHMLHLATPIREHAGNSNRSAQDVYDEAKGYIQHAQQRIEGPLHQNTQTNPAAVSQGLHKGSMQPSTPASLDALNVTSNFTPDAYKAVVERAKTYIHEGDIFQVVPSQRFEADFELSGFSLYRSLRRLNPSPFLFFLNFLDYAIIGSSPEILVRVRDDTVTIRPIAGTRKRGKDKAEDQLLADDLLNDPKERAEHLMLLDLGRNDVGRVAQIGSVNVTDSYMIELYSHVMHIVSNVEGKLHENKDAMDALFAGFPAGTVSGAPKIRAMQIIDELETIKRKFYGGCIGYFDAKGNIDSCIALRTAMVKDGKIIMQAGGGVVADSDPQAEYEETVNKSNALRAAALDALQQYSD